MLWLWSYQLQQDAVGGVAVVGLFGVPVSGFHYWRVIDCFFTGFRLRSIDWEYSFPVETVPVPTQAIFKRSID